MNRPDTFSRRVSQALEYRVESPLRFLATAVIARWAEDVRLGDPEVEIGTEWADLAEVPRQWLEVAV
jgi:2-hydroxychromene-2-carboxylate isomerase